MRVCALRVAMAVTLGVLGAHHLASAGQVTDSPTPIAFDGPPAPISPAVIARDESGRATMRAVRLEGTLRIDGKLDEPFYERVPAMSDFTQIEPDEGELATERTEVWLAFDRENIYISFRCFDSQMDRLVANEMRRDSNNVWNGNDLVGFVFDTFHDRRNGVLFTVTPIGGRQDGQVTNERQWNADWNPIWDVKVGRFERGWTVEAAVPFKSLRYQPGADQTWGFNVLRVKRSKNEMSFLRALPAARGQQGLQQVSLAGTLVGIEAPSGSKNLEIKPYATASLTTDVNATPTLSNHPRGDAGLDLKYGVTQNLTADVTINTDFAQVEADEQQVNLTRFSLLFPEKREFFLENLGTYSFGGVAANGNNASDTPILFYSRRIGLDGDRVVPLLGGGRLTGRVGRFSVGLLNVQARGDADAALRATNFSVVRLKRDLMRRSSIGLLVTGRSAGQDGEGAAATYGLDGTFSFFDNLTINTYWARTTATGRSRDDESSYRAQLDYAGDRYGAQLERLAIGADFNPQLGFARRRDIRKNLAFFRFSPRPRAIRSVRKFFWSGAATGIESGAGRLETRTYEGEFAIEFQNNDRFSVEYTDAYEFLKSPFAIASRVTIPTGGYDFSSTRVAFNLGPQRLVAANVEAEHGTFYSGPRTAVTVGRGRFNLTPQLSAEPTYSVNWIRLAEGAFTTHLLGSRVTYTMSPQKFVSALVQHNSSTNAVAANVRLRWEYRPGSELFVVYNEQRAGPAGRPSADGFPELGNRALIVKLTRLFRL